MSDERVSRETFDRVFDLATASLSGKLDDAGESELEQLVLEDPAARRLYVQIIDDSLNLRTWASETDDERHESEDRGKGAGAEEAAETSTAHHSPLTVDHSLRSFIRSHNFAVAVSVAFVAIAALVGWAAITYLPSVAQDADKPKAENQDKAIAWLINTDGVAWSEGGVPASTQYRAGQRLAISEGLVEIRYATGAEVTIEGPAEFTVGGTGATATPPNVNNRVEQHSISKRRNEAGYENCGFLKRGKLVARCETSESKGFTIFTPTTMVEDLGTEFAVEVGEDEATVLHVYDGRVSLGGSRGLPARIVEAGHAYRIVASSSGNVVAKSVAAGSVEFVRRIGVPPDATVIVDPNTLNGSFEDGTGTTFDATDQWFNYLGDATTNARNQSNPYVGSLRGIVGGGTGRFAVAPALDTGYTIGSGDVFVLKFRFAGAMKWDVGADSISATLYYDDEGKAVDMASFTVTPNVHFTTGYESFSEKLGPIEQSAPAVGKVLRLRFHTPNGSPGEFASIDDIVLFVLAEKTNENAATRDSDTDVADSRPTKSVPSSD
ncbi:MAG: FecR family protein [Pirellulales bacterium]|nr:FecR family protein [Pirellulales bacterium]